MESKYVYLVVLLLSILGPLARSFESRVAYYRSFGALFLSITIVAFPFLVWDSFFTAEGYWGFNPRYVTGTYLFNLPLEECLFFVVIPFCCVFIYRVLNYFIRKDILRKYTRTISNFLLGFTATMAMIFYDRWYSVLTFSLLALMIVYHDRVLRPAWLGRFYLSYLVVLIPFLIVNGILTGTGIEEEIVWYDESQMTGLRILSIPFEDAFYGMILIMGVVSLYEYFGKRWGLGYAQETFTE